MSTGEIDRDHRDLGRTLNYLSNQVEREIFEFEKENNVYIPDLLKDKVNISDIDENYNSTRFSIELNFPGMSLSKTLKSSAISELKGKIEGTLHSWKRKYQIHINKLHKENRSKHVDALNQEAKQAIETLKNILSSHIATGDALDWDAMKRKDEFRVKPVKFFKTDKETDYVTFNSQGMPIEFKKISSPIGPNYAETVNKHGFFSRLFHGKAIRKEFKDRVEEWEQQKEQSNKVNADRELLFNKFGSTFNEEKNKFEGEKQRDNEAIENFKALSQRKDPKSIEEYCGLVLNNSQYPDYFPKSWILEYREETHIVIVEYNLPTPSCFPSVESYKYIKSRDEVSEKALTLIVRKKLYNSVMYQICIRTIHELFEADVINSLDAVAFNGLVSDTNPATGIEETRFIMSIIANKDQFMVFDLTQVDPKATFKHMKGVATINVVDLTPIPPIIKLDRSDKRFISGRNVVGRLDKSINLAAMHWDDFEHLIRELFEKEFASNGGEVKVTQASSDGGVDAIAFDPDPIRGGKIVIQAKRYTNVVGVAAVRDLYGTVMNEGATKGILVTTSDYGKDSYEFAKGKPLTLINGSNLLSLLEKHGHNARINLAEAKKVLNLEQVSPKLA